MKLRKFIECEITHDKMRERAECYISPEHVVYIEEEEEYKGYCYIGLVNGTTTIVKGTLEEIRKQLRR